MQTKKVISIAEMLAKDPAIDAVKREFSYGKDGKSMVAAGRTGLSLTWSMKNTLDTDKVIAIAAQEVISLVEAAKVSADAFLKTGDQLVDGVDPTKKIAIKSLSTGRVIEDFTRFCNGAVQLTKFKMKSRDVASGDADTSNYDNDITSVFVSPFYPNEEKVYNLRELQDSSTFSKEFAEADFLKANFPAIISKENVLLVRVSAGTELVITAYIGAQDSRAQYFYRQTRKAHAKMLPYQGR